MLLLGRRSSAELPAVLLHCAATGEHNPDRSQKNLAVKDQRPVFNILAIQLHDGAIITGKTLGEGNREKAQEQGYAYLGVGFLLGLLSALVIMIISGPVINSYHLLPGTAEIAEELMIAISIIILFQAYDRTEFLSSVLGLL